MSSVQYLREFLSERLTAAAEEIFGVFERTIVQYEEEIERQRRLLDISWKPTNFQKSDLLRQYLSTKEKTRSDHHLFNQEDNTSLNQEAPEPPRIKEEHEKLGTSQTKEEHEELHPTQTGDHQDNEAFMVTPTYGQRGLHEAEPNRNQLLSQIFSETEIQDHEAKWHEESSCRELKPKEKHLRTRSYISSSGSQSLYKTKTSQTSVKCDVEEKALNTFSEMKKHCGIHTDLPQQYVCKVEEIPSDQQLCDRDGSSSLDQVEPGPPQIKEEEEGPEPPEIKEEEEEQVILKEDIDTFTVTSAYEESDESQSEPNTNQLLYRNYPEAVIRGQQGNWDQDFGSTSNAEPVPEMTSYKNTRYSYASAGEVQRNSGTGDGSVACPFCGKAFENKMDMREHYKLHTGEKSLSCSVCGKVFKYNVNLLVHMRTHTGEKPYSCEICNKCFSQKVNLNVHMRTHTGEKPYLCKTCGKRFSDSSGFKRHTTIHTGEKPYACKTCNKTFRYNVNLLVHMRTHTDERPYFCKTCGRTFSDPSTLRKHIITHTGAKSYSCQICGKCFTDNSNLLRHMRTHTGEKPYSCEICGKSFSQSSNLMQHIRTHTGEKPYPCGICDKSYSHSCTLLKHMRSHTGEKPYSCETCGRCFSHKCTLLKHMKIHSDSKFQS